MMVQWGTKRNIMAPRSKGSRLRLGEPFKTELEAFRNVAGMGNSEIGVVRDAVRAFIRAKTKDRALRRLYEEELRRLQSAKIKPLRIASSNGETKET
jgi:hypothetical protein